jgi:hypothetical protein
VATTKFYHLKKNLNFTSLMFYQGLLKFAVHFYNLTFNNRSYNLVFETEELSDARKNMMSIGQMENHTLMNVRFWHKADIQICLMFYENFPTGDQVCDKSPMEIIPII